MGEHLLAGEGLWDANDVAGYLKVSRSWVYQKVAAGLLPYVRIGGLVRFLPGEVRGYATARAHDAAPARPG